MRQQLEDESACLAFPRCDGTGRKAMCRCVRLSDALKAVAALESENAKLRRQVEFVAELADFALNDLESLDELATNNRQARYARWLEFETHEIDTGCYAVSWTIKDPHAEAGSDQKSG